MTTPAPASLRGSRRWRLVHFLWITALVYCVGKPDGAGALKAKPVAPGGPAYYEAPGR